MERTTRRHRIQAAWGLLAAVLLALPWTRAALAQSPLAAPTKTTGIQRTDSRPIIDGRLDEAEWANAAVIDDLYQMDPIEYSEASEKTEIYLLYDDEALYIGARMWDSQSSRIIANTLRQGADIVDDDQLSIIIDPFNTNRDGYQFQVNPNGVRREGLFVGPNQMNWNWQGIWQAAATRDDQGWTAEIVIPFKTLSFNPESDTWGINFGRRSPGRNERMAWVSRNRMQTPSIAGRAVGLSGMNQGIGLDVVPSLVATENKNFVDSTSDSGLEPTLDAYYRFTPSLSGALTVNTDFSAAEVDGRQVNLTRFSLFFPERRGFFLQDADAFEFGNFGTLGGFTMLSNALDQNGRPFFSRTIGLSSSGQAVDLNYGGKLSGRVGSWTLGALAIRQDAFEDVDPTDLLVARAAFNVLQESSIGVIVTDGDPASNLSNTLLGMDFRYLNTRLPSGKPLQADVWFQQSETEGLVGDDAAYGLRFRIPGTTGLRVTANFKEIQENFNPAMGFVNRSGIRDYALEMAWIHRNPVGSRLRTWFTFFGYERIDLIDGGLQSEILDSRLLHLSNERGDVFRVLYTANKEVLLEPFTIWNPDPSSGEAPVIISPGTYDWSAPGLQVETEASRRLSAKLTYRDGGFYNGSRSNVDSEITWFPSSHFRAFLAYSVNDIELPEGDFALRLARLGLDFIFSNTLSWVNLIQYDNGSENVGINSRLHWIPRAGREAFLVLNHNLADVDKNNSFTSTRADVSLKFTYTFRF
jgi:hypothetical protein